MHDSINTRDADSAKYGVVGTQACVEVLRARFQRHRFGEHAHDGWSLGAMVAGVKDIAPRGEPPNRYSRGDVYVIEPDRAHAGRTVADHGCEYVMVYVSNAEWLRQCDARGVSPGWLSSAHARNPSLAAHVHGFVTTALSHPERLAVWDGEWQLFWDELARVGGGTASVEAQAAQQQDWRVRRAQDFLRAHYAEEVTLEALASTVSMSVFDLCRKFSGTYGLSPHRYQLVLRVHEAKSRLLRGDAISEVALALGFADQSHLGRHFKSLLGITPGAVARQKAQARTF